MRFQALATDYDGTIATHGTVDDCTFQALQRLKGSGRKLILVTGRELPDLQLAFNHLDLFDRIVAENGALLVRPETNEQVALGPAPPPEFVERLRRRNVTPLSIGRAIIATTEPNESVVLSTIRELGLELQVIFNKGAVMILPTGINKATGLAKAAEELSLPPESIVGIGDAENDHAFLEFCGCGVAVANALPALKDRADLVTLGRHGEGVAELIDQLLTSDLSHVVPRVKKTENATQLIQRH